MADGRGRLWDQPLFQGVDEVTAGLLEKAAKRMAVPRKTFLFEKDDPCGRQSILAGKPLVRPLRPRRIEDLPHGGRR